MSWKLVVFNFLALLIVTADAIMCYNCTNLHDMNNYCEVAEIHHMDTVSCPNGRCISYDFRRGLFIMSFCAFHLSNFVLFSLYQRAGGQQDMSGV